jgi:hypothetical protein
MPGLPAATMAAMAAMSTQPDTGLSSFRRYTWWSLAGTTAFVLVVLLGRRILTAALPLWATVACMVALAVTTVAGMVLLSRRLAGVPPDGQPVELPVRPPAGWVLAGGGGAAVLGGILLPLGDDGVWSVAPAMMVAVVATFLSPRRRGVLLAAAAVAAAVLGGIAALASGSGGADGWLEAVLLPPQAAWTAGPPRSRPRRWGNRAKRTTRRGRSTPPEGARANGRGERGGGGGTGVQGGAASGAGAGASSSNGRAGTATGSAPGRYRPAWPGAPGNRPFRTMSATRPNWPN